MEMDLIDFRAMHLRLCLRDRLIDCKRFFFYVLRNRKPCDQRADLRHAMMFMMMRVIMVMMMFMTVLVVVMVFVVMVMAMLMLMMMVVVMCMRMAARHCALFRPMDQHVHMSAGDAALFARFCFKNNTRDPHSVQLGKRGLFVRHQFQEGCGQHVARRAHCTFDI